VSGKRTQDSIPQFPATFKAQKVWCLWRYEERDGKQTKVPYQVNGYRASSTRTDTWNTFEEVSAEACKQQHSSDLGIFADGSHKFIDLD